MRVCRLMRSSVTSRMRFRGSPQYRADHNCGPPGYQPRSWTCVGNCLRHTSVMLLAKYTIGPVKLFAGYEHMQFANPDNPLTPGSFITGGYSLGAVNNTNFTTDRVLQVLGAA